ncbi:uncharacterized protein EKO05_0010865 [Ascochyta rabiei]|uniref:uncharacterized protein n=1 Tax=Didymella rabiei TaxID=5454 RepID=UPI0021FC40F1|nr:uncharacterized protein EKO05_0010865 [Ascochyta rabiei]UPX20637.1 hypothetical protein EKO05_0010865 [Ascochyta rabiei]
MRSLPLAIFSSLLASARLAVADDMITNLRIKVQLFAAPAFFSEVSVDAYNNQCLSLDNNLIDGRVQSILVGGHDVAAVLSRDDYWYCQFFDNYDCKSDRSDQYLTFADGVNNLASIGWGISIHSLRCCNQNPSSS